MTNISDEKIPNNVNLAEDKKLQRALEQWQPNFLQWWQDMGPSGFQTRQVYLRTAVGVDASDWAHFDFVKMPDYRWGIFLADAVKDRKIGFGDSAGQPVWQDIPGEHRNTLRRLIVTQGDTEPASVEQQRMLGHTCPSMYDLRNLFQVNVEEGRHLWAMVYLLHRYFGRDGREEAELLLARRSGNEDRPRILGAFNEPIEDWLSFFMFTMFTDRDGKSDDVRSLGGLSLDVLQKYLNLWYSLSLDLFGSEVSTNAASFFAAGLKGRAKEEKFEDHLALQGSYKMELPDASGQLKQEEIPLRSAMNEVLRDGYVEDCQRGVDRWNKTLAEAGLSQRLSLPSRRFHRHQGVFAGMFFDPEGKAISSEEWERRKDDWLPSAADRAFVKSLQAKAIVEHGKMANWIAPPPRGINGRPTDFEYVRAEG